MTITDLDRDEALRREEFPVAANRIFLGNAAVCPLPRRVGQAMADYGLAGTAHDQEKALDLPRLLQESRERAGRLLGVEASSIALVGPTSVGLSLVANGLPWQAGDNVVFYPGDYPSNAVVWMNLKNRGVEPRPIQPVAPGVITREILEPLVDEKTRLVALASVHFVSGYRIDVEGIGRWLREKGVLFCLDSIQSFGALRTPLEFVDFAPADAHKWLLGPCGVGIFYVNPEAMEQLEPTLLGWHNVICPDFLTPETVRYIPGAKRYEAGSPNVIGTVGMHAGFGLIEELGLDAIEDKVLSLTRLLREGLRTKGYTLALEDEGALSGITACRRDDIDMGAKFEALAKADVVASLRSTLDRTPWIRFSPHAYNTTAEVEQVLSLM